MTKKNKEERWIENLALREAMQRLNSREKHIIELRFYEGKTQMEVAQESASPRHRSVVSKKMH